MTKKDFDVIKVNRWECPTDNGAPILTMPNIPKPLHGKGLQPRTIFGASTWNFMRKACYANADFKSEISGEVPPKGQLHAHELFSYNYEKQEGVFIRCIALTKREHDFIHSGRLITMFKRGVMYYPKTYVLDVVENGFKIIHEYNLEHPDDEPLRCYATILDYLECPELHDEIVELIEKYDIKFYEEHIKKNKRWKGWHVIVGKNRYDSPFEKQSDWEAAMEEREKTDTLRNANNPFDDDIYRQMREAMEKVKKMARVEAKIAGCKNGRLSKRKEKDE